MLPAWSSVWAQAGLPRGAPSSGPVFVMGFLVGPGEVFTRLWGCCYEKGKIYQRIPRETLTADHVTTDAYERLS